MIDSSSPIDKALSALHNPFANGPAEVLDPQEISDRAAAQAQGQLQEQTPEPVEEIKFGDFIPTDAPVKIEEPERVEEQPKQDEGVPDDEADLPTTPAAESSRDALS